MFDTLLGRKFTAKCKHAIKCIYERLKPIRNRKQAMVNILRKDIAELLRNGNSGHAFGRMDELIINMNHLGCYDMIEKFCECVVGQLPLLQRQRECPSEDMEAVSTLIFAAARFPDLPELRDLRDVFTTRYGNAMETSVNQEFKDKSASKSFSGARKLQLMKDIACEFSVTWDSQSFEYKITNPTASEHDQSKKRDSRKDPKVLPGSRKDGVLKHVVTEAKDIHVISHEPERTRKAQKDTPGESENVTPSSIDAFVPQVKPEKNKHATLTEDRQRKNDRYKVSSRAQEVSYPGNQEGKVVDEMKPKDDSRDRSRVPQVKLNHNVEERDLMEQLKMKDEARASHVPLVQHESNGIDAKESQDVVYRRSSMVKGEERQAVRPQKLEDNDMPRKVPQYAKPKYINDVIDSDNRDKDGFVHERSTKARQEADLAAQDGQQKQKNDRAFHMIPPPYVKPAFSKTVANSDHAKFHSQPTHEGIYGGSDKSSSQSTHVGVFAPRDKSDNGGHKDLQKDDLLLDDEGPKPRSVRRKHQKPPFVQGTDSVVHDDEPVSRIPHDQRRRSSRQNTFAPENDCDEEEQVMDKLLMHYSRKGNPDQPSKRRTRIQALPVDRAHHDGEAGGYEMNGVYRIHKQEAVQTAHTGHTINKGEAREQQTYQRHRILKAERVQALPVDSAIQGGEAVQHQTSGRYRVHRPGSVHPPERAVSLPSDPVTPKETVKGPARVTSMQPESLTSPDGRTHSRLPVYDELAARFAALKKL